MKAGQYLTYVYSTEMPVMSIWMEQDIFSIGYNILWCGHEVSGDNWTPVHKLLSWFSSQNVSQGKFKINTVLSNLPKGGCQTPSAKL